MYHCRTRYRYFAILSILLIFLSCNTTDTKKDKVIVTDPIAMDIRIAENIHSTLKFVINNDGRMDDSTHIDLVQTVNEFYSNREDQPVWSSTEKWKPIADSLFQYIEQAELDGLFRNDYHYKNLHALRFKLDTDSVSRMDALLWTKADLLMTDGFMHIIRDLKQGRLHPDSVTLNKDSVLTDDFFVQKLKELIEKKRLTDLLISVQPIHTGYWELKRNIKAFVDSMDRKKYTYLKYPYNKGDFEDSVAFIQRLKKRLFESNCFDTASILPDSVQLSRAIKKYQLKKGLIADGKYGKIVIQTLNNNDSEKYKRIALTLDKYKQLPEKMPEKYIWVNLPGYYLYLMDKDTIVVDSKIICGKPETRTPLLNSAISDMVTYPTWTVPNSIIVKQYLPKLKNNANYISKIGLKLMDNKGETIDPITVNWSKYSRGIPYKVMQESGDNNSLGVIKFNFKNAYDVYLHDTNQRYLFKNTSRAFSHGCVRVQEWEKLAFFIANNDSVLSFKKDSVTYIADSIKSWIVQKVRHRIDVKNRIPLFIRYFTCESKNGQLKFYDDIYGEDKMLLEKYFTKK